MLGQPRSESGFFEKKLAGASSFVFLAFLCYFWFVLGKSLYPMLQFKGEVEQPPEWVNPRLENSLARFLEVPTNEIFK